MMRLVRRGTSERQRRFGPLRFITVFLALLIIALGILELLPANDYILLPGDALPVRPMIAMKGFTPPKGPGDLYMTDVTLYKADHLLESLWGRLNPDAEVEPATSVSGNLSQQKFNQENVALMMDSIHEAEAAALNAVPGYKLSCARTGPEIVFTLPGTPAAKVIEPGDVLERVGPTAVHCAKDVRPVVSKLRAGQKVTLTIARQGKVLLLHVLTIHSTNGRPDKHGHTALIGIQLADRFDFPVKISIKVGNIGGPSAGLMFSLGIVERLEHRDLTHGCKIGGTGTIDVAGQVGEIGAAKQKILTARHAGMRYFFVPDVLDNVRPAMSSRGSVTVVPVRTLRQALDYLKNRVKACR